MNLRLATLDDAKAIAEVHVRSWQQAYQGLLPEEYLNSLSIDQREEQWLDILSCRNSRILLCLNEQELAGFLSFGACRDDDADAATAEIMALYVKPEHWRKGIGRALWLKTQEHLKSEGYQTVILWVVVGNERGISFWEALDFEPQHGAVEQFQIASVSLIEQKYMIHLND